MAHLGVANDISTTNLYSNELNSTTNILEQDELGLARNARGPAPHRRPRFDTLLFVLRWLKAPAIIILTPILLSPLLQYGRSVCG